MPETRDIVIIGAGHNGLVTAFYLAKAGFKPLVLECRETLGGCAITEEFHPGFKVSRLAHATWPLHPSVSDDMALTQHGLRTYTPEVRVLSLQENGQNLALFGDPLKSQQEIAKFSARDAAAYPELQSSLVKIGEAIEYVLTMAPPDLDDPASGNLWELLQAGRKLRGLGEKELYRLLRWGPMAVADLVAEFFETDLLRATVAAQGIFGMFLGPWSAGSSTSLIFRAVPDGSPVGAAAYAYGGTGALTSAMARAAVAAGVEIRTSAEVARIEVKEGAARSVVLRTGEEIPAKAVISNADPKRTLLGLVEPQHLAPGFLQKVQHYRMTGTVAKLNVALGGLPSFKGVRGIGTLKAEPSFRDPGGNGEGLLGGRIQISPEIDYLERAFDAAKYGDFSRQPYIEAVIPTLWDSSLAPAGKHVMSVYMQYAPSKLRSADWDEKRFELEKTILETLTQYAPDLPKLIEAAEVITPKDLEQTYGLTGGHIFHGELALDQIFTMRPLLGWAQYETPIRNLYLCGSGTHPGTGLNGLSGANAARQIIKQLRTQRVAAG
jgi:phytoene dehydrogenase-like protein